MSALVDFWNENRWGRDYGFRDSISIYALGYHVGQDILGAGWAGGVPVLRPGPVALTGRGAVIGGFISIDEGDGWFGIYCHILTEQVPPRGLHYQQGQMIPRLARGAFSTSSPDYPGSGWTGPHLHYVQCRFPDGAHVIRAGSYRDPRPIIRDALTAPAGGGGRPFEPVEDDMTPEQFHQHMEELREQTRLLRSINEKADWQNRRLGGSVKSGPTVTDYLRARPRS